MTITFKQLFSEENPVPVNNVQGGQVAALGIGSQGQNTIMLNKKKMMKRKFKDI